MESLNARKKISTTELWSVDAPVKHLYIHVPFCPARCSYCAFVTHIGSPKLMDPYLDAIQREAVSQSQERAGGPLDTVYFGGGTPSMMEPYQMDRVLHALDALWGFESHREITVEGHPSTLSAEKLAGFVAAGANRLSMGVESLQQDELQQLGRAHGGTSIRTIISRARVAGFGAVSTDLMYGIPGQTLASWIATLRAMVDLSPDHVSLYPLQIEPGTVFGKKWRQHQLEVPDDDRVVEMYHVACDMLKDAGFVHYEVASWARPGFQCAHNLAYWHNREFYAVGVGAHGYLQSHRVRNIAQTHRYIETVLSGDSPRCESIPVDTKTELSDTLILALRLLQSGIDLDEIQSRFNVDVLATMGDGANAMVSGGLLTIRGRKLVMTEKAVPLANEIWEQFI
ncbi:MAG: radical SAM family heme chaperone HemW [Chloroflexota bacterium]